MNEPSDRVPVLGFSVEMGVIRMRTAVGPSREEAHRPLMCLWVDHESGLVLHFQLGDPADGTLALVTDGLVKLVERMGGMPRQVQVRDVDLAGEMKQVVGSSATEVVVRESLPMLDAAIAAMMQFKRLSGEPESGLFDSPGMTLDHVAAFAEAARAFYEAAPWRHLIDDDLIDIESPAGPKGTRFAQVLGAGGQTFGLGFVATRQAHEELRTTMRPPRGGVWTLQFGDLDAMPYDDGEAWTHHRLPVAHADAYPTFERITPSGKRTNPTPDQLVWAEGLLRALASVTEEQLDSGRWEAQVDTFAGPRTYRFSLPILLEQMSGEHKPDPLSMMRAGQIAMEPMLRQVAQKLDERGAAEKADLQRIVAEANAEGPDAREPQTPAEQAQFLCYEAHAARGRRQVQLARQALSIDPDCCDALLLLAEMAGDPEAALLLLRRAVEAGERTLGPRMFEDNAGHFWGIVETRPYMRARQSLALALWDADELEEAIGHLHELLRLNPGDNQGNRYHLSQALFETDRLDDLGQLLDHTEYKDDGSALWLFSRALLAFIREGDSPEARRHLAKAHRANPHVAPLLIGEAEMPLFPPQAYRPGDENEAALCVEQMCDAWDDAEGALRWLEARTTPPKRRKYKQRKNRRR